MPHCNKRMLSFFLTTRCNLCCRYCYNAKERNNIIEKTIPIEIAKAAIDWYFSNSDSRHIRFYGPGEPTQEFEKMIAITDYARNHPNRGNDVTVEIQTNGVFNADVREWILNNANIVWVSFDGMKDIQNYNRPLNPKYQHLFPGKTSGDVLEENVKRLNENKRKHDLMVGARVTITDLNSLKQKEMVDYFYDMGIRYVWTDTVFYSVGQVPVCEDEKKKSEYSFNMEAYVKNYLEAYAYAKEKGLFWGSFYIINFDGETEYHCRCCTPLQAPHITPDGYISACDMVVLGGEAHHMDLFIVGKWNNDSKTFEWDNERIIELNNRKVSNMKHCQNCIAFKHCGGQCLGEIVNEFGNLYGQNMMKCYAVRNLFKSIGSCEPFPYLHP